jgi:hypothetical protein
MPDFRSLLYPLDFRPFRSMLFLLSNATHTYTYFIIYIQLSITIICIQQFRAVYLYKFPFSTERGNRTMARDHDKQKRYCTLLQARAAACLEPSGSPAQT